MVDLFRDKHIAFVQHLDSEETKNTYEYWLLEHLRTNGLYWGVTALATMDALYALPKDGVVEYLESCWDSKQGGFGAFPKHDSHILSTLSAVQILAIYGEKQPINHYQEIVLYIKSLQLPNGAFQGDRFGEVDTRFIYTALNALSILGALDEETVEKSCNFIMKCENFDGGFGMVPGAESHAMQVLVCVASLAICNKLHLIKNPEKLCQWLSERQILPSGGLNGRPEKLPDVCYSWWVLSSLAIFDKLSWIDSDKLKGFILSCQDEKNGGFSDRPENQTDVFHTCFGIAGLSLLQEFGNNSNDLDNEPDNTNKLVSIDPVYCMPFSVTKTFKKWPYIE